MQCFSHEVKFCLITEKTKDALEQNCCVSRTLFALVWNSRELTQLGGNRMRYGVWRVLELYSTVQDTRSRLLGAEPRAQDLKIALRSLI